MSSIRPQDRAFLCTFTFADGRRCRTPLSSRHPRLCFDHARKEALAHPVDQVGSDLSFFFSGDCVSARDLSAAIARLLPDLTHGQMKRKTASLSMSASAPPPKRVRPDPVDDALNLMQGMLKNNPRRINTCINASK